MKKSILLISLVFLFSLNAIAQTPNFAGEWTLDKGKSKLDERQSASIESQTLKVEQTEKEIKVKVSTKRSEDQGGTNNGGVRLDLGGETDTYALDGKEITIQLNTQIGVVPVTFKGEIKNGQLKLQTTRVLNTAMGEVTITTKETWILEPDGKTLTVKRVAESPNQTRSSEFVYAKKT